MKPWFHGRWVWFDNETPKKRANLYSLDWFCWENVQETMVFPMKYGGVL